MAAKKAVSEKVQDESAPKPKTGGKKSAAKEAAAPKKSETAAKPVASETAAKSAAPETAAKSAAPETAAKSAAPKTAASKKVAAAPVKLTASQADMLKKIGEAPEPGYRSEKKAEQRTIDALQERKLIKKGSKHKESGNYHYLISSAGRKHLDSQSGVPGQGAQSQPGTT